MSYVEGFVIPVAVTEKETYRAFAEKAAAVFKEHGALAVVECWADDTPYGEVTSFPRAVACREDEAVVFAWIIWPSRAAREAGNQGVMDDPRTAAMVGPEGMPFDGKRMIFGGFETLVEV